MYSKTPTSELLPHVLLVGVPAGLYMATLCCFVAYQGSAEPSWFRVGFITNLLGMGVALFAAVPRLLEWLLHTPVRTGVRHLALNLSSLVSLTANAWIYDGYWETTPGEIMPGIVLAALGIAMLAVGGWFGWQRAGLPSMAETIAVKPVPIDYVEERRGRHAA